MDVVPYMFGMWLLDTEDVKDQLLLAAYMHGSARSNVRLIRSAQVEVDWIILDLIGDSEM